MKKLLGFCFIFSVFNLNAQEPDKDQWGTWYRYFGKYRISEKVSILTEVQLRYYERTKNFNELVLRGAGNYEFTNNISARIGYAYLSTDDSFEEFPGETNIKEHRIFEQVLLKNQIWEIHLEHRYTLEQRFLEFDDRTDTQHRARYRLQLTVPLTDIFFLNLSEEVMLNLQGEIFNQNRLYAGLGVHVTNNLSVEAGFLKTHFATNSYERLLLGVAYNPDLRSIFKKK